MKKVFIILIVVLALVSLAGFYFSASYSRKPVVTPVIACAPEQRKAEICTALYQPVCAKVNIQCIKAPCNPVNQTISNACEACKNSLIESYTSGACAQ